MKQRDSERILLYLPFDELKGAPSAFREAYLRAWWHLLNVQDASENFHEGDTFEVDARPNGEVSRVIKCIHLIPWLLKARYLGEIDISTVIFSEPDELFIQSFSDTLQYIDDHKLLSRDSIMEFKVRTHGLRPRKKLEPLFISRKRMEWLEERKKSPGALITPGAHLEGPFSPNLKALNIGELASVLKPDDIILLGGSKLKGYGVAGSDLDIWNLKDLEDHPDFYPGSPNAAHIYFNSAWIGGSNVRNLKEIAVEKISLYDNSEVRAQSLERLESDLLQYRLLHKGFSRFTGITIFETGCYPEMDGDCPFYDDEYRRIATMLYAKYVQIPKLNTTASVPKKDMTTYSMFLGGIDAMENEFR